MGLPGIRQRTDQEWTEETGARLARLAMMAADGTTHHNPYYGPRIGYPTRMNTELLLRSALTPNTEPMSPNEAKRGIHPDAIFAHAWEVVVADEGDDQAALDLLRYYYDRVVPEGTEWAPTAENIERALFALASFDPDSLWTRGVQGGYPEHPQTPGSAKWNEAEAKGNPHESVANPFTRKP